MSELRVPPEVNAALNELRNGLSLKVAEAKSLEALLREQILRALLAVGACARDGICERCGLVVQVRHDGRAPCPVCDKG